ncbi:cytidylate kinase-like family protein [Rubripirellula reticaptiva]|uniref:Cytidylate kinase n=1 Tax=Rubripirellula reticaptiva TaxID=2528013 RepID=A0A5C6EIC3_9BACT|nr:cytidylate kinase-like family protein [Rubripirellula reticaptiva]TWU47009.1 cytidylate kinase [Rubripirellula reticaptiva]
MSLHVSAIEQRAESNIQKWVQAETTSNRLPHNELQKQVGPYLAVSRETGACGSEVAEKVAKRLQWDLLDHQIVEYMEQHYGTPRCLIQRVDERHENWLSSIVTARIGGLGFSESTFTHRVTKLLLLAASHGNVVIVGRGASFVLPRDRGLSVRIVAPMDFRVEQIMLQRGVSEKDARRFVVDTDHDREVYIKDHFHQKATDPHLYDLILNVGDISLDDAADTIVESIGQFIRKVA